MLEIVAHPLTWSPFSGADAHGIFSSAFASHRRARWVIHQSADEFEWQQAGR
jgi:hypothetical protein